MSLLSSEVDAVSDIGKIDLSPAYKVPSNIHCSIFFEIPLGFQIRVGR